MAYQGRSLSELSARTRAAYRRELPGTDATLAQTVLYVDAKVIALLLKEMDLRAEYLYHQIFASTADDEHVEQRHAYELGVRRRTASASGGTLSGSGTSGAVIPGGVAWLSGGVTYRSTTAVTIGVDGLVAIPVLAASTGVRTNRIAGDEMQLAEPGLYPSLAPVAIVSSGGVSGGADTEGIESLRARVLDRKRRPPQGGSETDYERFATDLSFVDRAWARRLVAGPGSVGLWFLSASGIPTPSEVEAVRTSIETRRLIGLRDLRVTAPVAVPVAVTLQLSPDTVQTRSTVETALAEVFAARARPGLPDDPFVLYRSWISEAISRAVGEDRHVLVSPSADLSFAIGDIPVPGAVSYV